MGNSFHTYNLAKWVILGPPTYLVDYELET